jgi:hypothetical protein
VFMEEKEFYYYLSHLNECHTDILRRISLLRRLFESDDERIEGNALPSRIHEINTSSGSWDADHYHVHLREKCMRDKAELDKERLSLIRRIRSEKHIVHSIEEQIYSLPELKRKIMTHRYIDKLSWSEIQRRTGRSAAGLFKLHKEAIHTIENALCREKVGRMS